MASIRVGKRIVILHPGTFFKYVFMIALVCFTALPLEFLVVQAFKPLDELFIYPPRFYVVNPTLKNFSELLMAMDGSTVPFTRYFFNSVVVTILTVGGTLLVCSLAAYSLTKLPLTWKNQIFNIIVATLMFSAPVTQISNYLIINSLGWVNTYWALVIPKLATPMYFFLLKQNFDSVLPNQLLEAAKIDGANEWKSFWKIAMPIMKPAWSTVIVFSFVANWNDYSGPLVYINREALKTLPLALSLLQGGLGQVARTGAFNAAALVTTAPTIIVYLVMQAKVMKTMAHAGIK